MALAVGRGFLVQPCSSLVFISKNIYKAWPARPGPGKTPRFTRTVVQAQLRRPTWLPGLDPPPYLDGR